MSKVLRQHLRTAGRTGCIHLSRFGGLVAFTVFAGGFAWAGETPKADLSIELNKLEASEKGCRAYLVINNATDAAYQNMKLDLVMFQPDGVIGKRFALDLAPLKPQKKTVKLFDLEATACDKVGSFLINDVVECKTDAGPVADCLQKMTVTSLTTVTISK